MKAKLTNSLDEIYYRVFSRRRIVEDRKAILLNPKDGKNLTAEELADILFYLEKLKNLQKRDKEKQKQQWKKLFNSIFAVFIAGLLFALGMQCGFDLFVKIASVL